MDGWIYFDIYDHDGTKKGINTTPWIMHTYLIQHFMEDISHDYDWTPLREVMHDNPIWILSFLTLDTGL